MVIILVAILEKQSKLFAALTATMPLTAPLAFMDCLLFQRGREDFSNAIQLEPVVRLNPLVRVSSYGLAGSLRRHETSANDPDGLRGLGSRCNASVSVQKYAGN